MSDLPAIEDRGDHVLLSVRAAPGASRDALAGIHGEALKVSVTAPPEKGKANAAILRVLARALGLRRSQLSIDSGETSRNKRIRVEGLEAARLREVLRRKLGTVT